MSRDLALLLWFRAHVFQPSLCKCGWYCPEHTTPSLRFCLDGTLAFMVLTLEFWPSHMWFTGDWGPAKISERLLLLFDCTGSVLMLCWVIMVVSMNSWLSYIWFAGVPSLAKFSDVYTFGFVEHAFAKSWVLSGVLAWCFADCRLT